MSQKYFTTLTHIGAALHANAQLQQTTVAWTHLVLGDGNGAEPVPNPAQTGVIREVDRLPISSIEPDPDNPSWIVIEAVIPADRGGYVVRETALMGGANGASCIAVGNYPSATKPLLTDGAGSELVIRVVVEIAHTATVTLKIDPAIVIASRKFVEDMLAKAVADISEDSVSIKGRLSLLEGRQKGVGDGQKWQNMLSERVSGVNYTNATGRTIEVSVSVNPSPASNCQLIVDGEAMARVDDAGSSTEYFQLYCTVPAGAAYKLVHSGTSLGIFSWGELR